MLSSQDPLKVVPIGVARHLIKAATPAVAQWLDECETDASAPRIARSSATGERMAYDQVRCTWVTESRLAENRASLSAAEWLAGLDRMALVPKC